MKTVEYKKIVLGSVFWLFSGMFIVISFIFALFGGGLFGEKAKEILQAVPYVGSLLTGFVGSLVLSFIFGLICGGVAALVAVIYNIFSMIFGGIKFEVEDKS